jgi:dTDP-4-amino-4,6-dideoxygalactose transaminase
LHEKFTSIRIHGKGANKYDNVRIGVNGRMDTMQAAVVLAKMSIFAEEVELRQTVASRYSEALEQPSVAPVVKDYNISTWAQYGILHPDRDGVIARLKENGIPTAIYYPTPLHLQEAFAHLGYSAGDFPVSEKVAGQIFSIPMHPYLTAGQQEHVVNIINGK